MSMLSSSPSHFPQHHEPPQTLCREKFKQFSKTGAFTGCDYSLFGTLKTQSLNQPMRLETDLDA